MDEVALKSATFLFVNYQQKFAGSYFNSYICAPFLEKMRKL